MRHISHHNRQTYVGRPLSDYTKGAVVMDTPHLITNVETTIATTPDMSMTGEVHQHLAQKELLPAEHLMDAGHVDSDHIIASQTDHHIKLIGPVQIDHSWQARHSPDFAVNRFKVDWEAKKWNVPRANLAVSGTQWVPVEPIKMAIQ